MKLARIIFIIVNGLRACAGEDGKCCSQIFLQSSGELGSSQSSVLGIYTLTNQRLANTPYPVYAKYGDKDFHLYYRKKNYGPEGWIVGGELLEDSYYISTGQTTPECPQGIVGGRSGANGTNVDQSFTITCHTDQVKVPCCKKVEVRATDVVASNQGGTLGVYSLDGDHNGYPMYKGGPMDSYLFYRKAGSGPDGWIISPKVEQNMFMVTTREKVFCPDAVTAGWDRDVDKDSSFSIVCVVGEEEYEDPGVPDKPIAKLKKEETMRSNTAVLNMLAFRLFTALYLLVLSQQ